MLKKCQGVDLTRYSAHQLVIPEDEIHYFFEQPEFAGNRSGQGIPGESKCLKLGQIANLIGDGTNGSKPETELLRRRDRNASMRGFNVGARIGGWLNNGVGPLE